MSYKPALVGCATIVSKDLLSFHVSAAMLRLPRYLHANEKQQ
jgi:hypothetical protein